MDLVPAAVLSVDQQKRAHICAWCKDKEQAEAWCRRQNFTMTHGICPDCQESLFQQEDFTEF